MAVFKCKMCGGTLEISENQSIITCEYCGTQQTLPKFDDDVTKNLFNRANNLRLKNEFDKAQEVYEKIISTGSTDAEAYWGNVLCKFGIEYVEDPATFKRVPTCHRAQLESVLSDVDYKAAIENADKSQKAIYEAEAKAIDELQKDILRIIDGEEPFDVFICYKETDEDGKRTQDSVIANDIYHQLTQEGLKVFYAAITLEDKLGQEYEPYIFAALNSAKVMLVVGTKPEYFNAVWVRNEWSRFLKIVKNDRKKSLIPCYKDMDAYDLPEEFSHLQAQDMSKIGFISDIVRGIKKLIPSDLPVTEKPQASSKVNSPKAPPVIKNADTDALVDKALLLIEDGNKTKAKDMLNKVLNTQPKNAEAYLGLLLLEMNVNDISGLAKCTKPLNKSQNYQRAVRFGSADLKNKLEGYDKAIEQKNIEKKYNDAVKVITKNSENTDDKSNVDARISAIQSAETALKGLGDYKDSTELIKRCNELLEPLLETKKQQTKKKNKIFAICIAVVVVLIWILVFVVTVILPASKYNDAMALSEEGKYVEAIEVFEELGSYKDSEDQLRKNNYVVAEGYYNTKDYTNAAQYYEKCSDYEDSGEKLKECWYQMARAFIKAEKQDDANALLEKIKDYKDSAKLIHYHDYEITDSKDATCEEDGYKIYKCSCGYENTETITATGHNFSAATCTEDGKCANCGAVGDPAMGHTAGTICERCGRNTFETLYFSGNDTGLVVTGIDIPDGKYKLTFSYLDAPRDSCWASVYLYDYSGNALAYPRSIDEGESISEVFDGPVTDGYIETAGVYGGTWTVTIEAF